MATAVDYGGGGGQRRTFKEKLLHSLSEAEDLPGAAFWGELELGEVYLPERRGPPPPKNLYRSLPTVAGLTLDDPRVKAAKAHPEGGHITCISPPKQDVAFTWCLRVRHQAEAAAREVTVIKDKQQLLLDMLVEGHPQSFVDFYYLTADEAEAAPAQEEDPEFAGEDAGIPLEALAYLKENLVEADAAARRGDLKSVYLAYMNLAQYFAQLGNHPKAIVFYQKCHDIAVQASDLHGELEANLHLGIAHEKVADTAKAIAFHERHLELASEAHIDGEVLSANQNLVQGYCRQAEEQEAAGNLELSVEFYHKMLKAAKAADDVPSQGLANYRIGSAHQKAGNPSEALGFHAEYLQLCKMCSDKVGEGAACCALAQSYQDLGDVGQAVSFLEQFLDLSKNANPSNHARACCSLGVIYTQQHKFERAASYFEKFFEVAKTLNDRRLLDIARINLGIARGSARTGRYMEVVANDINTLLQWKNVRMPIES